MSSWACVRARTRLWLSADGQNIQYKKSEKYTGVLVPYLQKLTEQQIAKGLVRYAVRIPLHSRKVYLMLVLLSKRPDDVEEAAMFREQANMTT